MRILRGAGGVSIALLVVGCGASLDVTRQVPASAAGPTERGKLEPVAIVRGESRIAIPKGAELGEKSVAWKNANTFVYKLADGDAVITDAEGGISAVRSKDGTERHFAPGTATQPAGTDEVRGMPTEERTVIALEPNDRIELKGTLSVGDPVPGGGTIEGQRSVTSLVVGSILLLGAYGPAAYVGAASPRKTDRGLLVPIVGPWIDLVARPGCTPPPGSEVLPIDPCTEEKASVGALITSGIVQLLGGVLVVVGLPGRAALVDPKRGGVTIVPMTAGATGAVAVGRF